MKLKIVREGWFIIIIIFSVNFLGHVEKWACES